MANKRINPQLPSGQVPLSVSRPLPLARPALVDPATERYDTSALAKGLAFFSQKAAERKGEMQEEAALKGREFVKNNPEVFAAAKDDESLERALKNAVKDGVIPRGLLPSFQSGIRKSIAEDRLDSARAKIKEEVIRYSGLDENGEPKDLSQVQEEIASISDRVIGEIPSSLLTDPEFGGKVAGIADNIRLSAQQEAFSKALSDRNDWAVKHAQESFQGVLDEVAGPLSSEEEEGLKAVLNDLTAKFKNRGVEDTDVALTDAIVLHATSLRNQSVEDALFFIESAGKFEVNGRAIGLDPALIQLQARLDEEFLRGDDRARIREQKELQRVQDAILEADGDLVDLRESGDLDGYEAALRAIIEELAVDPEIDGRVEILIRDALDRAEAEDDEAIANDITEIKYGFRAVPEGWQESYRGRISSKQYEELAAAVRYRMDKSVSQRVNDRVLDRAAARARSGIKGSNLSSATENEFDSRIAELETQTRESIDARRASLEEQGLPAQEVDAQMFEFESQMIEQFKTSAEQVRTEVVQVESQYSQAVSGLQQPTVENLSKTEDLISQLQGKLDPLRLLSLNDKLNEVRDSQQAVFDSLGVDAEGSIRNSLLRSVSTVMFDPDDPTGTKLTSAGRQIEEKFSSYFEDRDAFVKKVIDSEGEFSSRSVTRFVKKDIVDLLNGEGGSLDKALASAVAEKGYFKALEGKTKSDGLGFYYKSNDQISSETIRRLDKARSPFGYDMELRRDFSLRDFVLGLPEKEAAAVVAGSQASLQDVINGSISYKFSSVVGSSMPGGGITVETSPIAEFDASDVEWRIVPHARSYKALLDQVNGLETEDLALALDKMRYFQEGDGRGVATIIKRGQEYLADQLILINGMTE